MDEETIYDSKEAKQKPVNNRQKEETVTNNEAVQDPSNEDGKKKKTMGAAGAAGIGAAAGIGLTAAAVLIPMLVFPSSENENPGEETGSNNPEPPVLSGHLTGHDLDVASGVDDSMDFGQAFAAARHEVGPGGLFVWQGKTYGTYYANEWNALSPEEQEQYWADVNHTTSNIDPNPNQGLATEPQPEPDTNQIADDQEPDENDDDQEGDGTDDETPTEPEPDPNQIANNQEPDENDDDLEGDGADDETPTEPDPYTMPDEGEDIADGGEEEPIDNLADNGEDISSADGVEPLVLADEDIFLEFDLDEDGNADTGLVDANGNDVLDVILDTDGDGSYDTLVIDPTVDEEGNLVATADNIVEIGGVEIKDDSEIVYGNDDEPSIDIDVDIEDGSDIAYDNDVDPGIDDVDVDIEDGSDIAYGDDNPNIDDGDADFVDSDLFPDDLVDDNVFNENPDVDDFASFDQDPDITIDNDMDMSDFA